MEIKNKKAYFDYFIEDEVEAGIVLVGSEIKSLRNGSADIKESHIIIRNDEAYLLNMYIAPYEEANQFNHEDRRTRKLLLHKKQIEKIKEKIKVEGYTIVPLKLYFKRQYVKVLIGVAKGKKLYDKRETIKKRDLDRESRYNY